MEELAVRDGVRRVLVVDDLAASADTLRMLLELEGFEARVAVDGAKALEVAAVFAPDAVVLDLGLPGMDGYQVARQLRLSPIARSALLIALTGYSDPETLQRTREAGFDHHLVKPADMDVLLSILHDATR